MTLFWSGATALVLLAWALLWPAWRLKAAPAAAGEAHLAVLREQLATLDRELADGRLDAAQHALSRAEVQRRALEESPAEQPAGTAGSRTTALAAGLAAAVFTVAVYVAIGNPRSIGLQKDVAATASAPEVTPEAMEAMLTTLSKRLETGTGDAASDLKGWMLLGRAYASMQRFADAGRAFGRALALAPNDAQLLTDQADVLAMQQGQSLQGEPDRLLEKALQIDPKNLKALALAGSSAFERKDFSAARGYWQRARDIAPPGSEFAAGLDNSLRELGNAGESVVANAAAPTSAPASAVPAAPAAAQITGRVSLAPALAARVAPTDTVFIFARAAEGPRMPLAILKRTVADLPITFTLDDTMAMSPEMKLSRFPQVVVGARVSRSGNAMPQPGDLRGESAPTATRAAGLQLVIDAVQP